MNLRSVEAKASVPAQDFELSKQFYQDLGFSVLRSTTELAYLRHGARRAKHMGYRNVKVMSAGIRGWLAARMPFEPGGRKRMGRGRLGIWRIRNRKASLRCQHRARRRVCWSFTPGGD